VGLAHAIGYAWAQRVQRRVRNTPVVIGRSPGSYPDSPSEWAAVDVGAVLGHFGASAFEAARSGTSVLNISDSRLSEIEDSLSARLDRSRGGPATIKIGIDAGPDLSQAILCTDTVHPIPVQWVAVPPAPDDQMELQRLNLDALIRQPGFEPTRVVSRENPGRDSAWYDWSSPRPLTFASLFPSRIDPAAAVLSRTPARLTLPDRLRGRRPLSASVAPAIQPAQPPADRCVLDLAELLASNPCAPNTAARKAAARVVSAWMATTDAWVDLAVRRRAAEAALSILGDEPEVLLRAAAVRLAACDDGSALELILRAERIIRAANPEPVTDHLAFLQSEVEMGLPGPMTLGRVAAGICLVCATSPPEHLAYIRGDVMDDVRYSAWLVGRDPDRAMLDEIFRNLELARKSGESGATERKMAA
jgi:hypothetical protein